MLMQTGASETAAAPARPPPRRRALALRVRRGRPQEHQLGLRSIAWPSRKIKGFLPARGRVLGLRGDRLRHGRESRRTRRRRLTPAGALRRQRAKSKG